MSGPVPVAPPDWPRGSGYAHAMVGTGRVLFIAGQVGWDPLTQRMVSADFTAQAAQALANIAAVLHSAGGAAQHLARVTWYVTDRDAYIAAARPLGQAWRELFGRHYPAMSVVVVAALLEPGALVEIEATALLPASS